MNDTFCELLVSGFTRESEKECRLYMIIDRGIYEIICSFYPRLLRFAYFNDTKFKVSEDGLNVKGHSKNDCMSYTVYAESNDGKGFRSGTHFWSIQFLRTTSATEGSTCYHSIGVRTKSDSDDGIDESGDHWKGSENGSYYKGHGGHWNPGEVMTVKLNCDDWTVVYYKGIKQVQSDNIVSNESYHFCLQLCAEKNWTDFEIVETPRTVLMLK